MKKESLKLNTNALLFVRIDYPELSDDEAMMGVFEPMTHSERKFIHEVSLHVPIFDVECENGYTELNLIDQDILTELERILNKYNIVYKIEDYSNYLTSNTDTITETFKNEVIEHLDGILDVDSILDRISALGKEHISPLELLYLDRVSKGLVDC